MYNIAVIGATGNVGREVISILSEVSFPINNLYPLASKASQGKKISFGNESVTVSEFDLSLFTKNKIDIAFLCAGSDFSIQFAEKIASTGCIVIDKSSYFRMNPNVPLIIPEVNLDHLGLYKKKNIIATPNCTVTPLLMVLKPLHDIFTVKRVVVSTYQAVSGTGKDAMDELFNQTKQFFEASIKSESLDENTGQVYPKRIAFNCLPQCDTFTENGNTKEEMKIINETHKILDSKILVSATAVRVPVFNCHSESINIEFEKDIGNDIEEIINILNEAPGLMVYDRRQDGCYSTPYESSKTDDVFISRIRFDESVKNGLNLWCVCDNLRKGAALNGVQIAQALITENFI